MPTKPTVNKLRVFDKLTKAGYSDEKSIMNIDEKIVFDKSFTRDELIVAVQIKEAAKSKTLVAYLADPNVDLSAPKKEEKK